MVAVINYHGGNALSVLHALRKLQIPAYLCSKPEQLGEAKIMILPGVGSAKATLESLQELGFHDILKHKISIEQIPFIGICIGYQILFEHSQEDSISCWGLLKGKVEAFDASQLRVPQIGWNRVHFLKPEHPYLRGIGDSPYFYFVNSYYANPLDSSKVFGNYHYGRKFSAIIVDKNITAMQFHVEKSGPLGLRLLKNICQAYGAT